eukprot:TRINITY_DN100571_c0_g1_i1.p1 TRINITY_DN100571_c0_g1~~TRINITY_DN100571_c0_g1_i1.p1  ORF type:complete len:573 (+),score=72.24 TRINITY_DN100571_c0_g1_i1:107-1720(+)
MVAPQLLAWLFVVLILVVALPGKSCVMPHTHSAAKSAERHQRAIDRGFLRPRRPDHTWIMAPSPMAPAVRTVAKAMATHVSLDEASGVSHHHLYDAAQASRASLSPKVYEDILALSRAAGRAKHNVSRRPRNPSVEAKHGVSKQLWADLYDSANSISSPIDGGAAHERDESSTGPLATSPASGGESGLRADAAAFDPDRSSSPSGGVLTDDLVCAQNDTIAMLCSRVEMLSSELAVLHSRWSSSWFSVPADCAGYGELSQRIKAIEAQNRATARAVASLTSSFPAATEASVARRSSYLEEKTEAVGRAALAASSSAVDSVRATLLGSVETAFTKMASLVNDSLAKRDSRLAAVEQRISGWAGTPPTDLSNMFSSKTVVSLQQPCTNSVEDDPQALSGACVDEAGSTSAKDEFWPPLGATVLLRGLNTVKFNNRLREVTGHDCMRVHVRLDPTAAPIKVKYDNVSFPARCPECHCEITSSACFGCGWGLDAGSKGHGATAPTATCSGASSSRPTSTLARPPRRSGSSSEPSPVIDWRE